MLQALLALLGAAVAVLVVYLSVAAWSLHQAEKVATVACELSKRSKNPGEYMSLLEQRGFKPKLRSEGGHPESISTTFNSSVAVASYTCEVKVNEGVLQSAKLIYLD